MGLDVVCVCSNTLIQSTNQRKLQKTNLIPVCLCIPLLARQPQRLQRGQAVDSRSLHTTARRGFHTSICRKLSQNTLFQSLDLPLPPSSQNNTGPDKKLRNMVMYTISSMLVLKFAACCGGHRTSSYRRLRSRHTLLHPSESEARRRYWCVEIFRMVPWFASVSSFLRHVLAIYIGHPIYGLSQSRTQLPTSLHCKLGFHRSPDKNFRLQFRHTVHFL